MLLYDITGTAVCCYMLLYDITATAIRCHMILQLQLYAAILGVLCTDLTEYMRSTVMRPAIQGKIAP